MKRQVFAQKMSKAGYLRKIAGLLFTALILITMVQVCMAEPNVAQSWTEDENGKCIAYVRGLPDVQEVSAVIGTSETGEVTAARLQDIQDSHMMTYILVDNSASINQADKDKIRQIIYTLVENRMPGERFKFATFAEDKPLTDTEMKTLMDVAQRMLSLGTVPCTACHYCVSHCPMGLDIPRLLALYNEHVYTGGGFIAPMALSALDENKQPQACLQCRSCEQVCPQQIKISEVLKDFSEKLG